MTTTTIDKPEETGKASLRDRVLDASRQAVHVSHAAQMLETLAADAVDDGVHAAKRAMVSARRGVEKLGDLKNEAAHRVRRQPLGSLGLAMAFGLVVGVAVGWIGRGSRRREPE